MSVQRLLDLYDACRSSENKIGESITTNGTLQIQELANSNKIGGFTHWKMVI
jgi:hypothetical protein